MYIQRYVEYSTLRKKLPALKSKSKRNNGGGSGPFRLFAQRRMDDPCRELGCDAEEKSEPTRDTVLRRGKGSLTEMGNGMRSRARPVCKVVSAKFREGVGRYYPQTEASGAEEGGGC